MNIVPIAAFNDNYIWLLIENDKALVVDPGDAVPVLSYLAQHALTLSAVLITHHHYDHIDGLPDLLHSQPELRVYGAANIEGVNHVVGEGDVVDVGSQAFRVWQVAGHTDNHLAYLWADDTQRLHVFCGDTLFSAGCGRVFSGTVDDLHHSLTRFKALPDNSLFYPAHEYTANNLRFAHSVEPDNPAISAALLDAAIMPTLPVTLAHELSVNPFLRLDKATIRQSLRAQNRPCASDAEVFAALRQLKNEF